MKLERIALLTPNKLNGVNDGIYAEGDTRIFVKQARIPKKCDDTLDKVLKSKLLSEYNLKIMDSVYVWIEDKFMVDNLFGVPEKVFLNFHFWEGRQEISPGFYVGKGRSLYDYLNHDTEPGPPFWGGLLCKIISSNEKDPYGNKLMTETFHSLCPSYKE